MSPSSSSLGFDESWRRVFAVFRARWGYWVAAGFLFLILTVGVRGAMNKAFAQNFAATMVRDFLAGLWDLFLTTGFLWIALRALRDGFCSTADLALPLQRAKDLLLGFLLIYLVYVGYALIGFLAGAAVLLFITDAPLTDMASMEAIRNAVTQVQVPYLVALMVGIGGVWLAGAIYLSLGFLLWPLWVLERTNGSIVSRFGELWRTMEGKRTALLMRLLFAIPFNFAGLPFLGIGFIPTLSLTLLLLSEFYLRALSDQEPGMERPPTVPADSSKGLSF